MNNLKDLISLNNVAMLGIVTYIVNMIKGYIFRLYRFIARRYIKSMILGEEWTAHIALEYIKDHCYKTKSKQLLEDNELYNNGVFNKSLAWGDYLVRLSKFTWVKITSARMETASVIRNEGSGMVNTLTLTFYGFNRRKYIKEIKLALNPDYDVATSLYLRSIGGNLGGWYNYATDRSCKEIFGSFKDTVFKIIDKFITSEDIHKKYHKTYKTSFLLYGPPGTGKTSIIKNIAIKYGISEICYITPVVKDAGNPNTVAGTLSDIAQNSKSIYGNKGLALFVIEDIDKSLLSFDNNKTLDSNTNDKKIKVLDTLMQVLDSSLSPSNCIFIITTNHIEAIPEQLLRPGRIDHKIYVGNINKEEASKMCEYYNVDKSLILSEDKNEYLPAEIEAKIFKVLSEQNVL